MAAVYEAHDTRLDRAIALKVLPPEFLHDESFATRFEQEARVVARLDHPNIVPIFTSGIDEGIPWMSMRLATGGNLGSLLRNGRLQLADAVKILKQVAAAIDHAHGRGVTHRDIKPANILLDGEGNACVADFGLAHLLERNPALTRTGVLTGTPQYMAPEQALGKATGHACDVYSLGIVAYEMVVGSMPFAADSPVALLMKQVNEPLPDPPDCTIPAGLLDVIRRAASKDPSHRWDSAGAFIAALEMATRAEAHVPRARRALLAGAVSCTLLVALGVTWYNARQPQLATVERSALIAPELPAASSLTPPTDPVNPSLAGVPTVATPRRAPPVRSTPVEPAVESSSTNVVAPAIPLEGPAAAVAVAAEVGAVPERTPAAPVNRPAVSPSAVAEETAAPLARADVFTAPVRLKTVPPNYPDVARAGQIEGDVVLQAHIDRDGRVTDATITRSVHPLLDEAARQAVLRYQYEPGRRNGMPEASVMRITVSFRLR